jgi:hypothetical protein
MNKSTTILEVGTEGGSLTLAKSGRGFCYTSDETTLKAFFDDLTDSELVNKSIIFKSFPEAMESMIKRYPVFDLYPVKIHPAYKKRIHAYFLAYKKGSHAENSWRLRDWEERLSGSPDRFDFFHQTND